MYNVNKAFRKFYHSTGMYVPRVNLAFEFVRYISAYYDDMVQYDPIRHEELVARLMKRNKVVHSA